jgi:hypothetical protein
MPALSTNEGGVGAKWLRAHRPSIASTWEAAGAYFSWHRPQLPLPKVCHNLSKIAGLYWLRTGFRRWGLICAPY